MVARHARPSSSARRWKWAVVIVIVLVGGGTGAYVAARPAPIIAVHPPTTTRPPTTTSTTPVVASFTLSAVGDTDLGNTPQLPVNPTAYLAPVKSALAADIVFGNLEGTMTAGGYSKCGRASTECYAFRVPPSFAQAYSATGFTVLNSANNHSYDYGAVGEADTSAALRAAGIVQAGLPGQIGVVHTHGVSVAFVDFAPYALTNDLLDFTQAAHLIARAKSEAEVVVVYMHAGAEGATADQVTRATEMYVGENRGNPYAFAHAVIDDGADLVIASGPHVLRGMQWYKGHLIAYSLGDFTNYEAFASSGDLSLSAVLHVTMNAHGVLETASVTPIRIQSGGQAVVDPTHATWAFMNQLSHGDFGSSAALIGPLGRIAVPAVA